MAEKEFEPISMQNPCSLIFMMLRRPRALEAITQTVRLEGQDILSLQYLLAAWMDGWRDGGKWQVRSGWIVG